MKVLAVTGIRSEYDILYPVLDELRRSKFDEQSPAFQFYASDWISDPRRLKMPLESQGAYVLLFSHCWISRLIEFDFEIMSKMCNCRLEKMQKIWPTIEHMFEKKITFIAIDKDYENIWPHPQAASYFIPKNYKNLNLYYL